jgi:hypothetical protein
LKKIGFSAPPYLLPSGVQWREHFDYLTATAEKENPAAFTPKQKAVP